MLLNKETETLILLDVDVGFSLNSQLLLSNNVWFRERDWALKSTSTYSTRNVCAHKILFLGFRLAGGFGVYIFIH